MNRPSHTDILRRTRQLGRLDLSKASFRPLVSSIRDLTVGSSVPIQMSGSTEFYFRIRKNPKSKITKISDLCAPPATLVTGYQRCNGPAEPAFYAASDRLTALKETRVNVGDIVYLSQWIAKQPMPFNHVLAPDASHGFFERLTPAETTLYAFFDAVFTRNISSTFSDDYKLTAAIAKHLTTNFMPRPGFDIREDRSVGLRYSSVLNRESSFNVALKPKFAEERLQLCHLLEGRVIAIGEQGEPKLEILDNADHFLERTVVWSGDPNMIPLGIEDKNKVSFVTKNGQWTLPVYERPTTAEDIEEFVCEIFYQSAISGSK